MQGDLNWSFLQKEALKRQRKLQSGAKDSSVAEALTLQAAADELLLAEQEEERPSPPAPPKTTQEVSMCPFVTLNCQNHGTFFLLRAFKIMLELYVHSELCENYERIM